VRFDKSENTITLPHMKIDLTWENDSSECGCRTYYMKLRATNAADKAIDYRMTHKTPYWSKRALFEENFRALEAAIHAEKPVDASKLCARVSYARGRDIRTVQVEFKPSMIHTAVRDTFGENKTVDYIDIRRYLGKELYPKALEAQITSEYPYGIIRDTCRERIEELNSVYGGILRKSQGRAQGREEPAKGREEPRIELQIPWGYLPVDRRGTGRVDEENKRWYGSLYEDKPENPPVDRGTGRGDEENKRGNGSSEH